MLLGKILNLKDIYQHLNTSKDCLLLHHKILLHESVLTSTIPQIQCQCSHELKLMFLPFDGVAYLLSIFGRKVGKDDRVHGGFAGSWIAHEQHLLHFQHNDILLLWYTLNSDNTMNFSSLATFQNASLSVSFYLSSRQLEFCRH